MNDTEKVWHREAIAPEAERVLSNLQRDFIDLYVASQQFGLKKLIGLFEEKYARTRYNLEYVLKSLTYFEDAEGDPMPEMLLPLSWEEVKRFLRKEAPPLR